MRDSLSSALNRRKVYVKIKKQGGWLMKNVKRLRLWILLILIALAGTLSRLLPGGGDTSRIQHIVGESSIYSQGEIEEMMDIVEKTFRREFKGCSLTELKYDEDFSLKQSEDWAQQYQAEEAVVLLSSFEVDSGGGDGSLNPNSTYSRWMWVLTRDKGGDWELRTWGY